MKNFSLFFVSIALIFFISLCSTYSQTIIPGGYVSGMWTVANSPFQINGDITVHTDSALTIEPGVEVIFQGHYPFIINGILNAVGTQTDSIRFTAAIPDTGWRGLRFINSADTSHLAYCIIEYGKATTGIGFEYRRGGGIYVNSSLPPEISHCSIRNNLADVYGGGICFYNVSNDTIFITDCDITNNKTTGFSGDGGGIYFYGPNLFVEMQNCIISHNVSSNGNGGGICYGGETYQPNLRLTDCTVNYNQSDDEGGGIWMKDLSFYLLDIINSDISYNLAVNNGGGIYAEATGSNHGLVNIFASTLVGNELTGTLGKGGAFYGDPGLYVPYSTFQYTTIAYNQAFEGGGLYLTTSWRLKLDHCTMANNTATTGSGLFIESSSGELSIKNSILSLNSPAAIHNDGTILYLNYSDFYGNGINISGGVPAGFGQLVTTNYNGDSCDVGYNIFLDPLFEDPGSGNYQITWANWPTPDSTKSPCIDAGDPTSPLDPDGTITDMGLFSFDQSVPVELVSFTAELIDDNVLLEWITATETNNSGFEIQRKTDDVEWENIGFVQGHGTTTEIQHYIFTDNDVDPGKYQYKLKQIDYNGAFEYSDIVEVEILFVNEFSLSQNYPNPFNPSTTIKYTVPQTSLVQIKVFDILGTEIETLVKEEKPAGIYKLIWNVVSLPSGVYFYQLRAGSPSTSSGQNFVETKKMVLIR